MCGIVGIVDFHSSVDLETLREAAATLRLRGPDDAGAWVSENVGLGHRRLSIIDVSASGHQPMFSADGRYVRNVRNAPSNLHGFVIHKEADGEFIYAVRLATVFPPEIAACAAANLAIGTR